jgi:hypothetical protein
MIYVDREIVGLPPLSKKLTGSWMYFCFFKDHPGSSGIVQVYFNDKQKSGSIFYGDKLLNEYPDAYAIWSHPSKDNVVVGQRSWVREGLRGDGLGPLLMVEGFNFLKYMGQTITHKPSLSSYGNKAFKDAFGEEQDTSYEDDSHYSVQLKNFEQPVYPSIFFYKQKVVIDE